MRWVKWLQDICQGGTRLARLRLDRFWLLGGGVVCLAAVGLAAAPSRSVPASRTASEAIRTPQVEIINASGQVVAVIRGADAGGHLEIKDSDGRVVFSAGGVGENAALTSSWEHARHDRVSLRRDLMQQEAKLQNAMRSVRGIEKRNDQLRRLLPRLDQLSNAPELDQLRRAIQAVDRQVSRLRHDVDRLERR